ncbi:PQQ-dependent dehydrogenase, methanol/ethanol family [Altererythrobacter sp.]|uniref:PQQ-dependent dehydrogenase, methanol/ethanol family n=1 Tax=Altererythrobacter sp. TaxID=1872480 RepID=UPI001B0B78CE|nr:PQQ-dependent dehydrogenase, methanol/ethanol family [Altererythrobacter sp.]MBO6609352.1 PQQ-dependent dehydrogenase, methanol/ethanol family [Altererythrobacter sp.]MBO6640647.1 PQQ-dependent dehydrogenase, methanol/ethanol family [Altererythrobacter sp.]MBO6708655.1 PQQ-dependent dehydrogenase, methanol/ethanol family [Altererythrobacter sp.]
MKKFGIALAAALTLSACSESGVDGEALLNAGDDGANWITYGRTYDEQRFSPLDQINTANVGELGLAWFADMDTARGQEATPLVIDGKLYLTTAWSKVKAYDGVTGALLWEYDPEVPGETAVKACCDVVNRGLATWGDSLFLGTLDGRLVKLDRETGAVVWSKQTTDPEQSYTVTGAPRIIDGKVLIGNGGAEFGVRGYIAAYDAGSGEELWRFYTVPEGTEDETSPEYLQAAAKTWNTEVLAGSDAIGGGGTVWDSMAYDPDLNLLYIGVGNGSPWNRAYRSPGEDGTGEGDNLYLSSIVAIRPDTGEYVWHYQTTPGETWDYTATQHIMLADMEIDGAQRQVLMQAPKNGFFYVLDRATGEFISAKPYVTVNWATGIDESGRPIENPETRIDKTGQTAVVTPGALGGHNWHPMAYHPDENLVYIPAFEAAMVYSPEADWKPDRARGFNVGFDLSAGDLPPDLGFRKEITGTLKGMLVAWDPVAQEPRWTVEHPGPWNGGLLATAGGLVFQGTAGSEFNAYNAANGEKLWSFPAQTGVVAPPVTYTIDGEQYVAVLAGWGGAYALSVDGQAINDLAPVRNVSRLLVFKIGAESQLPPEPELAKLPLDPPPSRANAATIALGGEKYARYCAVCHAPGAVGSTVLPDLRRSGTLSNPASWQAVVREGMLQGRGMASFAESLSAEESNAIREWVIFRANQDKAGGLD